MNSNRRYSRSPHPATRLGIEQAEAILHAQEQRETEEEDFDGADYEGVWPEERGLSNIRHQRGLQGYQRYQFHPDEVIQRRASRREEPPKQRRQPNPKLPLPSDRVYEMPAAKRRYTEEDEEEQPQRSQRGRRGPHWLLILGLGMSVMLALWIGLQAFSQWWQIHQDDVTYGRPRTYQTDAVVGHNDSPAHPSHFIVLNFHSHVEIIELPGGDASKAKIYTGPQLYGQNADLAPVTVTFKSVTGSNPEMIVNFQGGHIVYLNQKGEFVPRQSQ